MLCNQITCYGPFIWFIRISGSGRQKNFPLHWKLTWHLIQWSLEGGLTINSNAIFCFKERKCRKISFKRRKKHYIAYRATRRNSGSDISRLPAWENDFVVKNNDRACRVFIEWLCLKCFIDLLLVSFPHIPFNPSKD